MNSIRLMRPYIDFAEVETDFRAVFDSGIFTRGPNVEALRADISHYVGVPHVHLATSATTALWVCLKLLNVGPGDEIVVSDFSFPATANVVEDMGARPMFADVSLETFNMLPAELERLLSPRTKAVIFVDAFGNPSGISAIKAICKARNIPLIEDAACAIGSSENGVRCGAIADLTCFSFHPRKLICSGEGGAITTHRADWSAWLDTKLMHGASGMKGVALDFVEYGYNFRLPELQAIMGRKQLAKIDAIVDERNRVRDLYRKLIEPMGFVPQQAAKNVRFNVQSLTFVVPPNCDRDELIANLKARGIESTIGTYSLSATTYYSKRYKVDNPNSRRLEAQTITLPCYQNVPVDQVVEAIRDVLVKVAR